MKTWVYFLLRLWVQSGLAFYFKQIKVTGRERIPPGAVIFCANHQNAFLDALLVIGTNSRITYFMARSDIFRHPLANKLLRLLHLLPVYRIRDGWNSLTQNAKSFQECERILHNGQGLAIFPEGMHHHQRQLKPLSKGFTRLFHGALLQYPELEIHLVPVGLNYTAHSLFRSRVHIIYGQPLKVNELYDPKDPAAPDRVRKWLSSSMKELITHIPAENYETLLARMKRKGVDFLDPVPVTPELLNDSEPESQLTTTSLPPPSWSYSLWRLVHSPVLLVWNRIRSKFADPVFFASIKFTSGIVLVPLWQGILAAGLSFLSPLAGMGLWVILLGWTYFLPENFGD